MTSACDTAQANNKVTFKAHILLLIICYFLDFPHTYKVSIVLQMYLRHDVIIS